MNRAVTKDTGPGVVDLIEEAVHLLRQHPHELAGYYLGTGPFAVALLYFWSYVTWFVPPDGVVAVGALLLACLFGVMKAGQHRFALRMLACRMGERPPRWTWRKWLEETTVQLRLHSLGLVAVPLAALFAVPFGWIYAYYQNATVLPSDQKNTSADRRQQAWVHAMDWPVQNHWALSIFSVLWFMVFLNLGAAFYVLPTLATKWLGLKTVFAISGWSYFNTTFLALVAVLTHLLVDPLIKTFYLLRIFHGRVRHTGADLRLVLLREKHLRQRLASSGLVLLLVGAGFFCPTRIHAAEPAPVATRQNVPPAVLDRALDRVLEQPEFRWRLHPLPASPEKEEEGIVGGFFNTSFKMIMQMARSIYHWFQDAARWLGDLFPDKKNKEDSAAARHGDRNPFDWMAALQLASYLLLVAVAGLLLFVAWKVWRHNRSSRPLATNALPGPAGTPDLRDENVQASHLPVDGWLDLARRQMVAGEMRLAWRALFLATLARHAQEGLVSLAKFKTNLDYETELQRRAYSRTVLVENFRGRRRQFEAVWYGSAPVADEQVRDWLQHLEGRA